MKLSVTIDNNEAKATSILWGNQYDFTREMLFAGHFLYYYINRNSH